MDNPNPKQTSLYSPHLDFIEVLYCDLWPRLAVTGWDIMFSSANRLVFAKVLVFTYNWVTLFH